MKKKTRRHRGVGLLFAAVMLAAGCDGDLPPPPSPERPALLLCPDPLAIHLSGTGAMGPLAGRLALAFAAQQAAKARSTGLPLPDVVVEESIGSGGGIRAAADGAVDLGMVSRPLDEAERALGLIEITVARDAVVLAAHPGVRAEGVSADELRQMYAAQKRTFADGTPAVLLLRDRKESANPPLERVVPGLSALREESYREHRLRVLYHDSSMAAALAATPGALGVFSLGSIVADRLPLKVLALDGKRPTTAAVMDGTWRATRDLSFVLRRDRRERALPFLSFVASEAGRRLTAACGYVPLSPALPPEGAPK
jgi:phosphate transport system substrate-binding protein